MPVVHFICGPPGAGKTTYAIALATRAKAVRFTIDEWIATLFIADRPAEIDVRWAMERTARCEAQMWTVADTLIARGVDVVFDLGVSRRDQRDRFRTRAAGTPASMKMHYLDVPKETRRARIRARNAQQTGTFAYEVSDAMFDWMDQWFEYPSDDELYGAMIVCDS
jgi:predicted kinase